MDIDFTTPMQFCTVLDDDFTIERATVPVTESVTVTVEPSEGAEARTGEQRLM